MKHFFAIIIFFSCMTIYGQNDTAVLIKNHQYKITYFPPCFKVPNDSNCKEKKIWEPTPYEIIQVDNQVKSIIRKYRLSFLSEKDWKKDKFKKWQFETWRRSKRYILCHIKKYNRQYQSGYDWPNGTDRALGIQFYYKDYNDNNDLNKPDEDYLSVHGGGCWFFYILFNYDQKSASDILVNARR